MNFGREVEKKSDRCGEIQTILGGLVVLKDNKQWDKGGLIMVMVCGSLQSLALAIVRLC